MKIGTLNTPIKHERKIEELIAEIDSMIEELCPMDEVAESLVDTLRKVNPSTREVIVVGNICMIEIRDKGKPCLKEVDIAGFSFVDLYTSMIAAVLN